MIWSTDTVLAETIKRAKQAELSTQLLPGWYDLDTAQELNRFVAELAIAEADKAVYTRQALATLGVNFVVAQL